MVMYINLIQLLKSFIGEQLDGNSILREQIIKGDRIQLWCD